MSTDLRRVVQLEHAGKWFTFTVTDDPPLGFWVVTWAHGLYQFPVRAIGDETPDFFRSLAERLLPLERGQWVDLNGLTRDD